MNEMPLIDFAEPTTTDPYKDEIAELIAAGDGKAYQIIVKTDSAATERLKFGKAANKAGKTARLRLSEPDNANGTTRLTFTLTKRHRTKATSVAANLPVEEADGNEEGNSNEEADGNEEGNSEDAADNTDAAVLPKKR